MAELPSNPNVGHHNAELISHPPRGYDVAALRKQMTAEFAAKFNDVELRKWCVEQAIKAGGSVDTTDAAKAIYVFVTEPSAPETSA